ncbi:MAG TPA: universal stress protein [Verrucomicrobiae bacterium]|jgi:amino acid transporter|nr:universal stress protein [Verrucomicrobiae bacterium]
MISTSTKRPRNVDAPRVAAILYGDWGTSKAYVIGLAFAVAGYSSFWLIAAMCLLTALVGVNYMVICRHYPDGGGVYASVRHRSEILSIVGAFLLIADYLVTAAISALSAFQYLGQYLGIAHPEYWAAGAIVFIGALNYFGPRHTGGLAFLIAVPTVAVVVLLGAFALPHLGTAWHNVQPLSGGFWTNWRGFVGVVLALSGVEAIANATGVMKLNPGSSDRKPSVSKTSTPAVLAVMIEVCFYTALLGLAMHALPHLVVHKDDVDAPGHSGVRDYMLGYMAEVFVGHALGATAAKIAAVTVSLVMTGLLLSAVNTAIVDLIAISFLMSRDGELPPVFQKLNKFGVPNFSILAATIIPAALVVAVSDMSGLADLYAIGVVGAITTNLGASATDKKLGLVKWERLLMFFTFVIMLAIELSLFWDKPKARYFATTVLVIGLVMRGLAAEASQRRKRKAAETAAVAAEISPTKGSVPEPIFTAAISGAPILCAVRCIGRTLDFALQQARDTHRPLYLLFIRALPVLTEADQKRKWQEDEDARDIFSYAFENSDGHPVLPCYAVSDAPAETIVDITATMGASQLLLGAPRRSGLAALLRGNIVRRISGLLPEDIHLLIYG